MTKGPSFSVVVPVYNRARTVLATLQSVQGQTFADFECLVVDDGSEDREELEAVVNALKDSRFRYVRRENGGGGAARNTGIDAAKAEFVAFLDSDDRWLPEKLSRDATCSAQNRVIFSPVLVERGGRIVSRRPRSAPRKGEPISEYLACRGGFTQTSTLNLPTDLARRVRFNEKIAFGQDTDFAVRLALADAEFRMLPEPLVVMRDDEMENRLSRSKDWRAALAWAQHANLTRHAYLAYRGSHVARMAADDGNSWIALRFYGAALLGNAFAPRIAAKALAQVLMRRTVYRRLSS